MAKQVRFSTSDVYNALLQAVAKSYNLSKSAFCAQILEKVIREEVVKLNLPIEKILGQNLADTAYKEISEEYHVNRPFAPTSAKETEEEFNAFQQYSLTRLKERQNTSTGGLGSNTIPDTTREMLNQMIEQALERISYAGTSNIQAQPNPEWSKAQNYDLVQSSQSVDKIFKNEEQDVSETANTLTPTGTHHVPKPDNEQNEVITNSSTTKPVSVKAVTDSYGEDEVDDF